MKTNSISKVAVSLTLLWGVSPLLFAAIIGTNQPAAPLTADRIARLPEKLRPVWKAYWENSARQLQADRAFFINEARQPGVKESQPPQPGKSGSRLPLNQPAAWYGQAEGQRIADIVISYQTPAGGWSKNLDMTTRRRAPDELFNGDTVSKHLGQGDFDLPQNANWSFAGTFDNSATTTQLRFLAKVIMATGPDQDSSARRAFLRGLDYIVAAQYPNGGWPQVWPLQGGYHDAITYNDGAMINVLQLLTEVAEAKDEFSFLPDATRTRAAAAVQRGLECILDTQIVSQGRRTVWCQQHDALTLQPTSARNYEMPAQCASESTGVLLFLMRLPKPNARAVAAVHAAVAWLEQTRLHDLAYRSVGDEGRQLVASPGAGPLWARCYEIGRDRPIFGDRDMSIHDQVNEISKERRNGYGWLGDTPKRALEQYARWSELHPAAK